MLVQFAIAWAHFKRNLAIVRILFRIEWNSTSNSSKSMFGSCNKWKCKKSKSRMKQMERQQKEQQKNEVNKEKASYVTSTHWLGIVSLIEWLQMCLCVCVFVHGIYVECGQTWCISNYTSHIEFRAELILIFLSSHHPCAFFSLATKHTGQCVLAASMHILIDWFKFCYLVFFSFSPSISSFFSPTHISIWFINEVSVSVSVSVCAVCV